MTYRTMTLFVLMMMVAACIQCGAADVTMTVGRVALKPGERQSVKVVCANPGQAEFNGTLKVGVSYDVAE